MTFLKSPWKWTLGDFRSGLWSTHNTVFATFYWSKEGQPRIKIGGETDSTI